MPAATLEPTVARAAAYAQQLLQLFPPGPLWESSPGRTLYRLIEGWGTTLARLELRVLGLLDEADPRTALALLPEWEEAVGLPTACAPLAVGTLLRRYAIVTELTQRAVPTPAFLVALAASLGFAVTIEEHAPLKAGFRAGDRVQPVEWAHVFTVHAPAQTAQFFTASASVAGDPLTDSGNDVLECTINAARPAQSIALFEYDLPASGFAPWEDLQPGPAAAGAGALPGLMS
jgi:uncharacterized protein YmfQ (DUF2313 family)